MDLLTIIAVALGLSFDTFAVSLSYGVMQSRILFWQAARIAIVLGLFQGGLTVAGYFLGSLVSGALKASDHWIALALLSFLGIKMIIDGATRKGGTEVKDYSKFLMLVTLAISTSIDAFAVRSQFSAS